MAYDKVVDSAVLDAGLKAIADAIREKGGTSDNLDFPTAMAEAIAAIESGVGGKYTTGTISLASTVKNVTVEHNLGTTPILFVLYAAAGATINTINHLAAVLYFDKNVLEDENAEQKSIYAISYTYKATSVSHLDTIANTEESNLNETTAILDLTNMSKIFISADLGTYRWIAVG